jgi:hypothetical protein
MTDPIGQWRCGRDIACEENSFYYPPNSLMIVLIFLFVILYCLVQAIRDYKRRNFVWAGIGVLCAIGLLAMPIETHAVRIDLPPLVKPNPTQ